MENRCSTTRHTASFIMVPDPISDALPCSCTISLSSSSTASSSQALFLPFLEQFVSFPLHLHTPYLSLHSKVSQSVVSRSSVSDSPAGLVDNATQDLKELEIGGRGARNRHH